MKNDGPSAMDQEFAKIFIPSFTDPKKNILATSAVLPGD
jgi:hypothetical protein